MLRLSALILSALALVSAQSVTLDYANYTGTTNPNTGTTTFLGMRYADAPTGNLRFRAPVSPPSKHLGNLSATSFGKQCVQVGATTAETGSNSEDCLFLNVFTPKNTTPSSALPVLVWFHGGGFNSGSSNTFSPDLMFGSTTKPFIFVTLNYRLGALGFLASAQVQQDGNMNAGLLDQRAALEWVQRYIKTFGGDPSRVTIWGESAGAGSTMFHLIANNGDGEKVFHAAMGDSPSLSYLPEVGNPFLETIYTAFAGDAGCAGKGAQTMACLRAASGDAVTKAWSQVAASRKSTFYLFAPTRDGTFINKRPIEAFSSGAFAKVPVLFGSNTDEGQTWFQSIGDPAANPNTAGATEHNNFLFLQGQFANLTEPTFNKALELYPISQYENLLRRQSGQMYGEMRYICPALLIPGAAQSVGKAAFQFHYDNPRLGAQFNGSSLGTTHGSELIAFFGFGQSQPANADDNALFEKMRQYFTSFVTDGKPIATNAVEWQGSKDTNGSPRLFLNPQSVHSEEITQALSDRCAFWRSVKAETNT